MTNDTVQTAKLAWTSPKLEDLGDTDGVTAFAGAGGDTSQPGPSS